MKLTDFTIELTVVLASTNRSTLFSMDYYWNVITFSKNLLNVLANRLAASLKL